MENIPGHHFFHNPEKWFEDFECCKDMQGMEKKKMIRAFMTQHPQMDIYENNANIVAEIALPGIDPKNISIEVENNILKIEGKREEKIEEQGKGYLRRELTSGYYKREISLPVEVEGEKTVAEYEDGILKVTIPKKKVQAKKKNKIKVRIKNKN